MKNNNLVLSIIAVTVLIALLGIATYAYFVGNVNTNNVANLNAITEQNNMVFDVTGGNMALNVTVANMVQSKAGLIAARNMTSLTVSFTPNTEYSMVCTYDIVYEWTSADKYTTHSLGVTDNEFTIQANLNRNDNNLAGNNLIANETDLSTLSYTNNKTTVVTGAKISGSGSTTQTAEWTIRTKFYNADADQVTLSGKNYAGKFSVEIVSCIGGSLPVPGTMMARPMDLYENGDPNGMDASLASSEDDEIFGHEVTGVTKNNIGAIYTMDHIDIPNNAIDSWDVSTAQDESVMAWIVENDDRYCTLTSYNDTTESYIVLARNKTWCDANIVSYGSDITIDGVEYDTYLTPYELYIGQEGGVVANPDSRLLFSEFEYATILDLSNFYTYKTTNMYKMFYDTMYIDGLNVANFNTSNVINMAEMFVYLFTVKYLDTSSFDTSNVTNMNSMFECMEMLIDLDLGPNFDTSKVTDMQHMFDDTPMLLSLDLGSNFDTGNVTNMNSMFFYMKSLTSLDLGDYFDTSNVTNMSSMFNEMSSLTSLDLGDYFDTSNVTNMNSMFYYMSSLTSLDLGLHFDTSNVTTMRSMFSRMSSLTSLDLGLHFDTSNVTNMNSMFYDTSSLTSLDLGPNFNTSNVDNMSLMFYGDINLKKIYVPSSWSIAKLTSSGSGDYMFTNCYKLSGAISYDSTKTNKSYANYTTGYLTLRSS